MESIDLTYRRRPGFSIKNAKIWVIPLHFRRFQWQFQWQIQENHQNFRQIWWLFIQLNSRLNSRQIWWHFLHLNFRRFLHFTIIFAKIGENLGENSIENQFRLYPQKILPSKVFKTVPHLKTLGVSIGAFIRIFITGSKSQPTIYYHKWPWHLMMVIRWNLTMLSSYPPVHYW